MYVWRKTKADWLISKALVPAVGTVWNLITIDLTTAPLKSGTSGSAAVRTEVQRPVETSLDGVDDEVLRVGEDERPTERRTAAPARADGCRNEMSDERDHHDQRKSGLPEMVITKKKTRACAAARCCQCVPLMRDEKTTTSVPVYWVNRKLGGSCNVIRYLQI